jgi:hypothetical protein
MHGNPKKKDRGDECKEADHYAWPYADAEIHGLLEKKPMLLRGKQFHKYDHDKKTMPL